MIDASARKGAATHKLVYFAFSGVNGHLVRMQNLFAPVRAGSRKPFSELLSPPFCEARHLGELPREIDLEVQVQAAIDARD